MRHSNQGTRVGRLWWAALCLLTSVTPRAAFASAALAPLAPAGTAEKALQVLCTIPDAADVLRRIGGEDVEIQTIAKGTENVHAVRLKPSHVVAASRADCFVEIGLSLEHSWVPGLLRTARNERIRAGAPGFVMLSEGWHAIDVPTELSRRHGTDLHPEGNPHLNLSHGGGRQMAKVALEALTALRPEAKARFEAAHAAYAAELKAAEARWKMLGEALAGTAVVSYHSDFDYLARELGMQVVGTIEPKPGVPPTPRHLAELTATMKEKGVKLVLVSTWANKRQAEELCERTGATLVSLPTMVGGVREATSWIALLDHIHAQLAEALGVLWEAR